MGAKQSQFSSPAHKREKRPRQKQIIGTQDEYDDDLDLEQVTDLTLREKELIKKTWNKIEMDAERVGANTFSNLFEMHPSVKTEFIPFSSIDVKDEKYNQILREHGVRVLSTFGKMVRRIDDDASVVPMLKELGTRHGAIYNAKSALIGIIGPHFLKSIQKCLGKEFTAEMEAAYSHMFQILTYYMKSSLVKASMNYRLLQ